MFVPTVDACTGYIEIKAGQQIFCKLYGLLTRVKPETRYTCESPDVQVTRLRERGLRLAVDITLNLS